MDIFSELKNKLVNHRQHGIGIIDSIDHFYVKIQFENKVVDFRIKDLTETYFDDLTDLPEIGDLIQIIEQDESLEKKISTAERKINGCYNILKSATMLYSFQQPLLSKKDILLSLTWHQEMSTHDLSGVGISSLIEHLINKYPRDYELGRVLSARTAEKAAHEFYSNFYQNVEDVSIKQIHKSSDDGWKIYDLLINNEFYIDVKNSRRSLNSPEMYTEHCVPRFKVSRSGEQVLIAGILSPYLLPYEILSGVITRKIDKEIIYLGETNYLKIESVISEYSCEGFAIDFKREDFETRSFLPPWVFDYPEYCYTERKNTIDDFKRIINENLPINFKEKNLFYPLFLAAGLNPCEYIGCNDLTTVERVFVSNLLELVDSDLSMTNLYLMILSHFILSLKNNSLDHSPLTLSRMIFFEDNYQVPLGLFDPLHIIITLLRSLDTIYEYYPDSVLSFDKFKLTSLNILQAKHTKNNKWYTLLAYCGGFTEHGKCGFSPLVLGRETSCPICRKLICPVCGYCSLQCERTKMNKRSHGDIADPFIST